MTEKTVNIGSVDDLQENQMKQLTVDELPVLLTKWNGMVHALGGTCPHYGAPLHEGTLHDGHVICPWHQAKFDLKTGDLLEPCSLDALERYDVRIERGDLLLSLPANPSGRRQMAMAEFDPGRDQRTFAVIGGGAVAATAVEALRQEGYQGRIVMVSQEDRLPYDRPNCSKGYLAGEPASPWVWLDIRSEEFYNWHHIERLNKRVAVLDVPQRTIQFDDGATLKPDKVLVASGAVPRRLDVAGANARNVLLLRSLSDCNAIIARAGAGKKAVIVGDSFIGMEVASSLAKRGMHVTIVGLDKTPFAKVLGEDIASLLRKAHEAQGNVFKLGRTVSRFNGEEEISSVTLDDGTTVACDFAVVGIGVRPATDFIKDVPLNPDGSLDVDGKFRVAEGVYAAGDVACYPDPHHEGERLRIEHWRVALQQGRAAARAMAGNARPFDAVPFFWTEQCGMALAYMGWAPAWDEVIVSGDLSNSDFVAYLAKDNRLLAMISPHSEKLSAFEELMRLKRLPPAEVVRGKSQDEMLKVLRAVEAERVVECV